MTRQEAEVVAAGLMIPQPFAAGDGDHPAAFKPIDNEPISNDVNFVEGFTAAFAAPGSQGGRYVTRQEMNAIGYLASVNEFKRQTGGINTYNPTLAAKIGGYPKGAVLEYLDGLNYYRVISRVDNNLVNFNEVGVDGTNWAFCEQGFVSDGGSSATTVIEIPSFSLDPVTAESAGMSDFMVCSFKAPRSGVLNIAGEFTPTKKNTSVNYFGFGLYVKNNPSGSPKQTVYDAFYASGFYSVNMTNHVYSPDDFKICSVTKDELYTLWIIGENVNVQSQSMKVTIL